MIYKEKPLHFEVKTNIVACYIQYQDTFLLLQRQPFKNHGECWGLPAGKVESNEDLRTAVLREIFEETGLVVEHDALEPCQSLWVENLGHEFEYHTFKINLNICPKIVLSKGEHKDYRWVTPSESLEMNLIHDLKECNQLFFNL